MVSKSSNPILTMAKAEWRYLGPNRKKFVLQILLFAMAALIGLLSPWLVGQIFNSIQSGQVATQEELTNLFVMISFLLVIKIAFWIFHGSARIMEILTAFKTHEIYANSKIKKIVELPVSWHKDHHSGDTIDRVNKARLSLQSYAQHQTFQLVYILVEIFGALGIIFFINPKIGAFALLFCSLILGTTMSLDKKIKKIMKTINKYDHQLSASIFDYLSNIITVITLRLKEVVRKKINEKVRAPWKDYKKSTYLIELKWGLASLAIVAMTVIILIYQAWNDFTTTGIILIGTLYMLYSYLEKVGHAFFSLAQFYGTMTKKAADIESVEPIDQAFAKIQDKIKYKPKKNWKKVDIKNLNFSYNSEDGAMQMKDVDFTFNRGQKIALIGESGSGKSTILTLLRGLYSPKSSKVYLDDKLLKNGLETLKRTITLIPQDPEIFNETIRYNIAMDMFHKKHDILKATQMAQFQNVVDQLPKGLDTGVQEKGVSLSGGEKQRLALARGILAAKDSDIILLDEPTSSVDSVNEKKIHDNIFKEFKDKTIISSIHRLHLLDKFDYIYMFDKGRVVGQGTLEELKSNPKFMSIWRKYVGSKKKQFLINQRSSKYS
ncbi:ABC transporter ATP-binding protein [Methanococcoides sp. SA1]|nr:ABC transporter ATP-binding protein [Methanococcoides sp. SA1]